MFSLDGKIALVTGGARGLGRADCLALSEAGARVVAADVNETGAENTAEMARAMGRDALALKVDVRDRAQVKAMIQRIKQEFGAAPDILVNNAATLDNTAQVQDMPDELWDRDIAVNLTGAYNVTKALWPELMAKKWGRVISMASVAGTMGGFGQASYAATKAALIGFTRTLALEGARHGITANAIVPGIIGTEAFGKIPDAMRDRMRARVAMRREGEPRDIATLVVFLASPEARYITGAAVPVTGGLHLFTF
ncbi:MAG: 3-oxoacyl-ACP reductase FabG [Chloroflexi bacterium]|nr:3-oxoacyl-ACP reductase FabG [Chloroflexota bacterium]